MGVVSDDLVERKPPLTPPVDGSLEKRVKGLEPIDIHALRHTFGTHLCAAGVPLRIAQAAMRHSDPSLTANVYTDPKLLDVAGALEMLPRLDGVAGTRQIMGHGT